MIPKPRACPPVINVQCVQIGSHRLYHGDAYQIMPVLTAHGPFDALAMDPPYVLATSGGGRYRKARKMLDDIEAQGMSQGFDPSMLSWKYANAIVCFGSNDQILDIVAPRLRQGFRRVVLCAWHKTNPQPVANRHYRPDTEYYVHAWQQNFHPHGELADKDRYIMTLIGKSPWDHPTVKPDAVMNKIVTNLAGTTICDPFMGTGSTGVAAIKQGRIFTGIELEEKYFNIACERVRAAHEEQSEDYR